MIVSVSLSLLAVCPALAVEPLELPERGLCAHRGAMNTHPENTLAAFREAGRLGAHMIEFDVYLTKDSHLVVIHDATVDRTTDGVGRVSEMALAEIKALDAGGWKSAQFAGERVPTLTEALRVMPLNCWLNVHLKGGRELGERVARVVERENRLHQAFLACGVEAAEGARSAVPGILICNMERQGGTEEYVDLTIELGAKFIQLAQSPPAELAGLVKILKDKGIRINYFGTDDPQFMRELFEVGVEFPLVNTVEVLMGAARELGIEPLQPVWP
ncbi:MAG: glycerophosphodiester phosphodiesterase [Nitrospiraceae bacterium]|nr:glycerophosphodiester phosphodiesterase [Nitrospiraceae bacterium]